MGVGQARDGDLVRLQPDPSGERVRPGLEVHLGPGEGHPPVADADGLDPAEAVVPASVAIRPVRDVSRGMRRLVAVGGVGRPGSVPGRPTGSVAVGERGPSAARRAGRRGRPAGGVARLVGGSGLDGAGGSARQRGRSGAEGGGDRVLGVRVGRRPDGRRAGLAGTGRWRRPRRG